MEVDWLFSNSDIPPSFLEQYIDNQNSPVHGHQLVPSTV
jgi:hypothetical protein